MDWLKLALAIMACLLAGAVGSLFTTPSLGTWYASLEKPPLNPPSWVFAPVWSTLYVLMGISLYLVWSKGTEKWEVREGMALFGVQLILNSLWSIAFFGMQSPFYALIVIVLMLAAIALTMLRFWSVSRGAALLLLPYFTWVFFAAYLNYSVWALNP